MQKEDPVAPEPPINIRAPFYVVLQATHLCDRCKQPTPVIALALPPDHECTEIDIELDDEDADSLGLDAADFSDWLFRPEPWHRIPGPAMISSVRSLAPAVADTLRTLAPHYRINTAHGAQWGNVCAHCDHPIWDGALYPTPGQTFCPKDADAATQVSVQRVDAPFEAFYDMCWTTSYRNKWPLFARMGYPLEEAD